MSTSTVGTAASRSTADDERNGTGRGSDGGRDRGAESARVGPHRRPTALELVGVVGVVVGFGLLAGTAGVVVAVAVAGLWYVFSGVYGFAAGQFVLAASVPPRLSPDLLTPELVAVEAALVVVLVGGDHHWEARGRRLRRLVRTVVVGVLLVGVALGVTVGSASVADETRVLAAVGVTFLVLVAVAFAWGRVVVSPVVEEPADADVGSTAGVSPDSGVDRESVV
jgi:hypothetical protein